MHTVEKESGPMDQSIGTRQADASSRTSSAREINLLREKIIEVIRSGQ
jgi:hypothetical protein